MGRAGRKQVQGDGLEPGGARTHWTETHPDRKMWSPGRLAIARTQTREEYEALYGRSKQPDIPNLPAVPEGLSDEAAAEVRRVQALSDKKLLGELQDKPLGTLARGARLYKKSGPLLTDGLYQRIIVRTIDTQNGVLFESLAEIEQDGVKREETIYKGLDLGRATSSANSYIDQQRQNGYRHRSGVAQTTGQISERQARLNAEQIAHGISLAELF